MTIGGTWPMLYCFFGEDGGLRREAFSFQIEAARIAGAAGVAVLGLGSEVGKLGIGERHTAVEWIAAHVRGNLPFAVTIADGNLPDMIESAKLAVSAGAAWLILQPPRPPASEGELLRFFGAIADAADCPVGIQNAPEFLGIGLSHAGLIALNRNHPNVAVVKAEASALAVGRLIDAIEGRMAVFNGRAGLELTDNFRVGVAGMIPGIETIDRQVAIERAMRAGDEETADTLYREILPGLVFMMAGIEHFLLYGKLLAAHRLGLPPSVRRAPSEEIDLRGAAWIARLAAALGPLPH